jgi:hypothetical protein
MAPGARIWRIVPRPDPLDTLSPPCGMRIPGETECLPGLVSRVILCAIHIQQKIHVPAGLSLVASVLMVCEWLAGFVLTLLICEICSSPSLAAPRPGTISMALLLF